jgi:hypothetical protein
VLLRLIILDVPANVDKILPASSADSPRQPAMVPHISPSGRTAAIVTLAMIPAVLAISACRRETNRGAESLSAATLSWRPLARFGGNDRSDAATLGLVADVAADRRGRTYVLDVANRRVAVFSQGGVLEEEVGRHGQGPGELQVPTALAMDARDRLYVLDIANARLEVFDVAGERTARIGSLPLEIAATDLCALGNRLFVLAARGGRLIHELSSETGHVIRSLAPDLHAGGEVMAGARASGHLACGPSDALTFLPSTRGEVIRFSATNGETSGRLLLPGYRAVQVTEQAGGAVVFRAPDGGPTDNGSSIVNLPHGRQLVQVGVATGGGLIVQFNHVRSYLVSWVEGSVTPLGETLPRIVSTRANRAYTVETEPFPSVQVLALDSSARAAQ